MQAESPITLITSIDAAKKARVSIDGIYKVLGLEVVQEVIRKRTLLSCIFCAREEDEGMESKAPHLT